MSAGAALATWKHHRLENEVELLSRPNALGMVQIRVAWTQQETRAHRDDLTPKNEDAERMLAWKEQFVALVGPVRSAIPRAVEPAKPKPARLPGQRIERDRAQALFGHSAMLGIRADARLRLLGLPTGAVVLRAYDADGLICERVWTGDDNAQTKPTAKKNPVVPIPPPIKLAPKKAALPVSGALTNEQVKAFVHPDFGVELRAISASDKVVAIFGSHGAVRKAMYGARKDATCPPGWAFSILAQAPSGMMRVYVAAVRKSRLDGRPEAKSIIVFRDDQDRLELAETLNAQGIDYTIGEL